MAYINFLVYSDDAIMENGKFSLVNPMTALFPLRVPGQFSFTVTIGVMEITTEKENYKLRYTLTGPLEGDAKVVIQTDELDVERPPSLLPSDYQGGIVSLEFKNVDFREEGTYTTEIFLDGTSLGKFPIKVRGRER